MDSPAEPWQWSATGWKRRLYGGEAAFASFGTHPSGRGHSALLTEMTITSTSYPANELRDKLQEAWLLVRYHVHPLIAVDLARPTDIMDTDNYIIHYPDTTSATARQWARDTVVGHTSHDMPALVAEIDQKIYTTGCSGAELHFAPTHDGEQGSTVHIVFTSGHWITDGRGAFQILNKLVSFLNSPPSAASAQLPWGSEATRLTVPLAIATGKRQTSSATIVPLAPDTVHGFMQNFMQGLAQGQPAFEKPLQVSSPQPATQIVAQVILDQQDSKALLDRCRAHDTTVTALLNVLIAITYVDDPIKLQASKTVPIPFFSVHRGEDQVGRHQGSLGLCMTMAPFAFKAGTLGACLVETAGREEAIWKAAREAIPQLKAAKESDAAIMFDHEAISALVPMLTGGEGQPFFGADVLFVTSVGRISPYFPRSPQAQWTVRHVANGFAVRWYRIVAHCWEWEGRTTIRLVASDQYHSQEELDELAATISASIREVLGPRD